MNPTTTFREEDLIKAVYYYPELYNHNHPNFRNKSLKDDRWKEIAKHLKTTSETVQKRWKSLHRVYGRHLKAEQKNGAGSVGKSNSRTKWAPLMERFREFYKLSVPSELIQVDPVEVNRQYGATMGEETREAIAWRRVLDFMKQSHPAQQQEPEQPQQQPTSAKKRRAAETVSSSRAAEPTTSTATSLFQPDTPGSSWVTPVAPPVEQQLNETITSTPLQEQPTMGANAEAGAALDAMDHFMLKCAKRMKKLPPDVQADLQMQISEVITHNELDHLRKINTWQNK